VLAERPGVLDGAETGLMDSADGDQEEVLEVGGRPILDRQGVEVCDACGGYIKGVMRLTPMTADDVVLYDVTSLELDVAAVGRGYHRAAGKAHELAVSVVPRPSPLRRLFGFSR
jgi:hypothetical protein